MTQEKQKNNDDLDKIDRDINFHRIMVFLILLTALIFYVIFINFEVTDKAQTWGPVGDFFGGILNPIFALFAFYWLTYSVRLQIKELKETRQELSKAATAQQESAIHQKSIAQLESENVIIQKEILISQKKTLESQQASAIIQQQQIGLQNFESLFFQLLKSKSDITIDIKFSKEKLNPNDNPKEYSGKDAIRASINAYVIESYVLTWENYYKNYKLIDYMDSYFLITYQILKLIDSNQYFKFGMGGDKINKQIEYFEIFKSTLNRYELEVLFFFCLSKYSSCDLKRLIEKYGFFKSVFVSENILSDNLNKLSSCAYMYHENAFENSDIFNKYLLDLSLLKEGLNVSDIDSLLEMLCRTNFIKKRWDYQISYTDERVNSSSVKYIFTRKIKWENRGDIFKEINIVNNKFIEEELNEIKYINHEKTILNQSVRDLEIIKKYFENNNEDIDVYKNILLEEGGAYCYDELVNKIIYCKERINESKNKLDHFKVLLGDINKLNKIDYIETVFIIIKYNIDYFQYWDYIKSKEEAKEKKSA